MSEQWLQAIIFQHVLATDSVLDVGCGLAAYHGALANRVGAIRADGTLGQVGKLAFVEAHLPYVVKLNPPPTHIPVLVGAIPNALQPLRDHSFDVVLALDVLEHLTIDDVITTLGELQRVAKRAVVFFSPEGYHPQEVDHWKLGGERWQTHRTTMWLEEDGEEFGRPPPGRLMLLDGRRVIPYNMGRALTLSRLENFHKAQNPEAPHAILGVINVELMRADPRSITSNREWPPLGDRR